MYTDWEHRRTPLAFHAVACRKGFSARAECLAADERV